MGWGIVAKFERCRLTLQPPVKFGKLAVFERGSCGQVNQSAISNAQPPVVWVLTGHKAGDNAQVTALAEALGWPYEIRRLCYRRWELLSNRLLGVTLAGIDRKASSTLEPPWPDLVISAGRRNEPVARWIRRRSGSTRLVHLGRPWAPLATFDLIIATPQYFLPEGPNILHNHLPLHGLNAERLARAADTWRECLRHLPRPWTALLVGGDSGPFVFTREKGRRLGRLANALAQQGGGSLLVSSSARTPARVFAELRAQISAPAHIHAWRAGQADNPYLAYLALADQLVVTGESMSMLTEAAWTRKPLYIFDPADPEPWWRYRHNYRFKPLSHRFAMRFAPRRMHRDVGRIQQQLVQDGRAAWLGDSFPEGARSSPLDDLDRAVQRVRALLPGVQALAPQ